MIPHFSFSISVVIALLLGVDSADVQGPKFGYSGPLEPSKWAQLDPAFSICSLGKNQSPVNIIRNETVLNKELEPIYYNYSTYANASLVNLGFSIGIEYEEKIGGFVQKGKKYNFKDMHWHSPSEHKIDGVSYPAELHAVHVADDGAVAVFSFIYKYGKPDPLFKKIEGHLHEMAKTKTDKIAIGELYTKMLRRSARKYYRYMGSYTTPPCTEGIMWTLFAKRRSLTEAQLEALKAPLSDEFKINIRPEQPLNGRRIELYDEQHSDEL